MILVRHGLMIVGDPIGGKSCAVRALAAALGSLHEQDLMDEHNVNSATLSYLNRYIVQRTSLYWWHRLR